MAWLDIAGGVGRGISRGAEDWRAWDEEKRKKQAFEWARAQEEYNAGQRKRTLDEQRRADQYRDVVANGPVEGDGQPVAAPYNLPETASFGPDDPIHQVKGLQRMAPTMSASELARWQAQQARGIGLPGEAEKQTDRAYKLEGDAETSRQRRVTAALSMAGTTLATNPEASLRALEPVLEGTGATLIVEDGKWGLAMPGQGPSAKPRMVPGFEMKPIDTASVATAMQHAYGYLNSENFFKSQTLGVENRKAAVGERGAAVAERRAAVEEANAPSQRGLWDSQARLNDRLPAFAPRESAIDKLPMQPILFTESGQHGWVRPTFDPKSGVASYILPKGAVSMKTPDKAVGQPIELGDLKKQGWSGLQQQNFESGGWEIWGFQNGQRRLYAASPGRGDGNWGTKADAPNVATAASRMGARPASTPPNVSTMPGPATAQAAPAQVAPANPYTSASLWTNSDLKRLADQGDQAAAAELARRTSSRGIPTDSWGRPIE